MTAASGTAPDGAVLDIDDAEVRLGERTLWRHLTLTIAPGEFVAVLGANGSGKTTLLRAILGEQRLAAGSIRLLGRPVGRGSRRIGYIPQQRADAATMLRGRDLVALGVDGDRWGIGLPNRRRRERVDALLDEVGATAYAGAPLHLLSGGEQQRLRVAQALGGDPVLMLCDEPLLSLDLTQQRVVSELVDEQRRRRRFGVLFVTHDINPVLPFVDRVLYLADGRFRIGTPDEVLQSSVLSELYRSDIDVVRVGDRILVAGGVESGH